MHSDFEKKMVLEMGKRGKRKNSSRRDGTKNNKSDEMIWDETEMKGQQTECIRDFTRIIVMC